MFSFRLIESIYIPRNFCNSQRIFLNELYGGCFMAKKFIDFMGVKFVSRLYRGEFCSGKFIDFMRVKFIAGKFASP